MTNEEILKAAIEKAVGDGFNLFGWKRFETVIGGIGMWNGGSRGFFSAGIKKLYSTEQIIFSHGFAKAFWGYAGTAEDGARSVTVRFNGDRPILKWQYHLQQMVIQEDPIKYLEQFLK